MYDGASVREASLSGVDDADDDDFATMGQSDESAARTEMHVRDVDEATGGDLPRSIRRRS